MFPAEKLTRNKQDTCDSCVRVNIIFQDPNVGEKEIGAVQDVL